MRPAVARASPHPSARARPARRPRRGPAGDLRRQPPQPRRHPAAAHVDPRAVAPQARRRRGRRLLLRAPGSTGALSALAIGAIPIERTKVNRRSADLAAELIDDGWSMLIFPEGGRSPDGWGQPFRGGAAYLVGPQRRAGRARAPRGHRPHPGQGREPPAPGPHDRHVRHADATAARRRRPVASARASRRRWPSWPTRPRPTGGRRAGGRRAGATPVAHRARGDRRGAGRGRSATARAAHADRAAAGPTSTERAPAAPTRTFGAMTIRLRQVALVAHDLEPTVDSLSKTLGVDVCYRDPGVAEFGLVNALFALGDAFLEVVSPQQDGTTAGRLLEKHGGDYGYMVIMQLLRPRGGAARGSTGSASVSSGRQTSATRRAHTCIRRTSVGAILSLDWMDTPESWKWAGPEWQKHVEHRHGDRDERRDVAVPDPEATATEVGRRVRRRPSGAHIDLDHDTSISFVKSERAEDEGVCGIDVKAADRARAGETLDHLRHHRDIRLMRYGVAIPHANRFASASALDRMAAIVEDLGFDSIWTSDHIIVPEGSGYIPEHMLEPLATLSHLAARTQPRDPRGSSVLVVPVRDPVFTAKYLSSLDVISGGRLVLGVGIGWLEEEFRRTRRFVRGTGRPDRRVPRGDARPLGDRDLVVRRQVEAVREHAHVPQGGARASGDDPDLGWRQHRARASPRWPSSVTAGIRST